MNERIQQLFWKAGGKTSVRNLMSNPVQIVETNELWDDEIEKFAQLIVKECLGLLGPESAYGKQHIKKHFGVEEQTIKQDQVPLPTTREQAMAMLRVATFYLDTQK